MSIVDHAVLLVLCVLSVEIVVRSSLLNALGAILHVTGKAAFVMSRNSISDHWKEKVVPEYALRLLKLSTRVSLVVLVVLFLFVAADYVLGSFRALALSLIGAIESVLFATGYYYLRKSFSQ